MRPARQRPARRVRFVVFGTAFAVVLMMGAPAGAVRPGGTFPLAGLLSWMWQQAPDRGPTPPMPAQPHGTAKGRNHYVAAVPATGGSGRAPGTSPHGLGAYQAPKQPAPKPGTTGSIAGGHSFSATTSKRVAKLSTATSDTYQNTDGSFTRKMFERPVNFKGADGSWQPIDSHLVTRADHRLHVTANSIQISIAQTSSAGASVAPGAHGAAAPATGGTTPSDLADMGLTSGQSVGWSLTGAATVAAATDGTTVTYASILPSTDLQLSPFDAGLNELLILHSADAPSSWVFPLDLHGLAPRLDDDGGVSLLDASGEAVAWFPHGHMADSNVDPQNGSPQTSSEVTFALVTDANGEPALQVSADPTWLHDPARVWPITVDPTTITSTTDDVYVDSDSSTTASDQNGNDLAVGTWNAGTDKARSFMHFPGVDTPVDGMRVTTASLKVFLTWAFSCTNFRQFNVDKVTQAWTVANLSTASYPGPTISAPIGSLTPDPGVACTNTAANRSVGVSLTVPLATQTFNDWSAGGPSANNGLALTAASETDSNGWKRFTSSNYSSSLAPQLTLTYTANVVPQIDSRYPLYGYATPTLSPELLASGHDPDGFPNVMTYDFKVFNKASVMIKDSGWTSAKSYIVPAGTLSWGQDYTWTAQAKDGLVTSATPTPYALSTPVPQPPVTAGLAQNGGQGFDPSGGNYTTSATDASVASVGPTLSVERDYNSEDPRTGLAFGAGWSSVVDTKATEQKDTVGTIQTVVVTYPTGQEIAFGRNTDGSFVPPPGHFATFKSVTGGYQLIDKDSTAYTFTTATGVTGQYGLTSITDAQARVETFAYTSGKLATMTGVSGRALHFTWATPAGATTAHVATVVTDPVVVGSPSTALTWTYTYTADALTKVCSPASLTACTTYTTGTGSQAYDTTMNFGPSSFWRLGDASGSVATSAVTDNEGTDNGTYKSVTLGQTGPLPGSTSKAAGFNGTSSTVHLPGNLVADASYQTVSMWFKLATGAQGVLLSYQADPTTNATTPGNYTPALYVGTSGKLYGQFWDNNLVPMVSAASVANGQWHQVVLTGGSGTSAGTGQSMYLDGVLVGSKPYAITLFATNSTANEYIGSGFMGGSWPDQPHFSLTVDTGYPSFFNGSIADTATFSRALTATQVSALYATGHVSAAQLTSVALPSGKVVATVAYDQTTNRVTQVTDANGGVWKLSTPVVSGSSGVYAGAVLGAGPADYWRMNEGDVPDAINQVNGNTATYNLVGLGTPNGPFADATVGSFNGTSSFVDLHAADIPTTSPVSISMWFKMPTGSTTGGVLFSYQAADMVNDPNGAGNWTPALYVGIDGKVHGEIYMNAASSAMTASPLVNDGNWHHVAITATSATQTLYVDGVSRATLTSPLFVTNAVHAYVGAGKWSSWPQTTGTYSHWPGQISDVAYFTSTLSAAQVSAEYAASTSAGGTPLRTVTVTDPANLPITHIYDVATGRQVSETDALGKKTQYTYDTSGFLHTVTDPNLKVTTTTQDPRGNTLTTVTCQNSSAGKCSTLYYTYYPDDTSTTLTPDPRNDMVLTMRDGRSANATDPTYLTTYAYDTHGNRTSVAAPLSRTSTIAYTDGTTVAALDTGFAPAGLPMTQTTPGGAAQQIAYLHNGDVGRVTDPAGMVTTFTYDGLGRAATTTKTTDTFPAGHTTSFTYDPLGQVLTQTDPAITDRVTGAVHTAVTSTVYDADGLPTSHSVVDTTGGDTSRATSMTYNTHDLVATKTDAFGKVSTFTYDLYGNVITQVDPDGVEVDTAYDADGHLLTSTLKGYTGDPNNPTTAADVVTESRAYYPTGQLASVTDANGWTTSYVYTENGLTQTVTRTDGTSTLVLQQDSYDADGNLTTQVTNNGTTTTTSVYDAAGRMTSSTLDPAGLNRTSTYTYNPDDQVTSVSQADGTGTLTTTDTGYDAAGRKTSQTVHNGASNLVTQWHLDTGGLVTYMVDAAGNRTDYSYDDAADQVVTTGPAVMVETGGGTPVSARPVAYLGYDTFGEPVEEKDPNGDVTILGYDAAGRVLSTRLPSYTAPGAGTAIVATATQTYDAMGRVSKSFDPLGHETDYAYDQMGNASKVTTADGAFTTYTYDLLGDQLSVTDPTGAVNGATYDYLGRKVTSTQVVRQASANDTTHYFYATSGRLSQVRSPASVDSYTTYDPAGEVLTQVDGASHTTGFSYDGLGQLVKTTSPDSTYSTASYDPAGRVTGTAAYDASAVLLSSQASTYDSDGNKLTSTDGRGTTTTYTYDPTGMPTSEIQPISSTDAITTSFGYDAVGNRTRFTDGRGNKVITTYNSWNLPESRIEPPTPSQPNPGDGTFTTSYDAAGRVTTQASPGGVTVSNTYDLMDRVTTEHGAGADAATVDRTFGYDNDGRVTSASGGAGADAFTYDDRGLLLSASGISGSSSFGYNADGSMTSRVDAAGTTTYGYDTLGRLATAANTATGVSLSVGYNTMSQPSTVTYGTGGDVRSFAYDGMHRVTSDQLKTTGGATVAGIVYGYDADSNETAKATSGFTGAAANTYTYDLANRLASWNNGTTTTTYSYDKSGNRLSNGSKTFTYDQRNQLQAMNGTTVYNYTLRGTLSSTVAGSSTQHTTTDAFGQAITQDSTGGATQTYSYDGLGRVIQSGFAYSGAGNTVASDGTTAYTRDPGDGLLGASSGAANTMVWTDQHTDVVGQFAATGAALGGSATYDPLGAVLAGAGLVGHLGYQSEWTDNLTGRVNMAARWYNPNTGQFDSRDSASRGATPASVAADRFAYADDNPLTGTDPSGHITMNHFMADGEAPPRMVAKAPPRASAPAPKPRVVQASHVVNDGHTTSGVCIRVESQNGPCASQLLTAQGQARLKAISDYDKVEAAEEAAWEAHERAYQKWLQSSIGRRTGEAAIEQNDQATLDAKRTAKPVEAVRPKPKDCDWDDLGCQWNQDKAALVGGAAGYLATGVCEVVTAGAGSIVCAAIGSGIGNVVTDAMQGLIHGVGDALGSFLAGAAAGAAGAALGSILSSLVSKLADCGVGGAAIRFLQGIIGRLGGAGGRAVEGAASGAAVSGGYNVATQLVTTGNVDWGQAGSAATGGAVIGAAGGLSRGRSGRDSGGERGSSERSGSGCLTHSFDPATPVLMADGTTEPIKDVKIGDQVTSTDPVTGDTTAKPVTALHLDHDTDLTDITVTNTTTGKTTVLHTTWHHPFWNPDAKRWTDARDLTTGTRLQDAHAHTTQIVTAVKVWTGLHWMRDLTIATTHTYYVIAAGTAVLVHNTSATCSIHGPTNIPGRAGTTCTCDDNGQPAGVGAESPVGAERPGESVGSTAGEVDQRTNDTVDGFNNVAQIGVAIVPGHQQQTLSDGGDGSLGGAAMALGTVYTWAKNRWSRKME